MIYPELKGRLDGHAVRVPLLNASLLDAVFHVARLGERRGSQSKRCKAPQRTA